MAITVQEKILRKAKQAAIAVSMLLVPNVVIAQNVQEATYIPAGMALPVYLMTTITVDGARKGSVVKVSVNRDVVLPVAKTLLPSGTTLTGMVTDQKQGHQKNDDIIIVFDTLALPDGRSFPIQGQFVGIGGTGTDLGDPNAGNHMTMQRSGASSFLWSLIATPLTTSLYGGNYLGSSPVAGATGMMHNVTMNKPKFRNLLFPAGSSMQVELTQQLNIPALAAANQAGNRTFPGQPPVAGTSNQPSGQPYAQPNQSYGQPNQSYAQPSQSYGQPSQSYGQPSQSYAQPSQSYGQPSQSYAQPNQPYAQPSQSYAQPNQPYAQPNQSYGQPNQSYAQPNQPNGQFNNPLNLSGSKQLPWGRSSSDTQSNFQAPASGF